MSKNVKRLHSSFKPEHYDIEFKISEDKKSFTGTVVIKGKKTGRPSERITLHQKALKISNVTVSYKDKKAKSRSGSSKPTTGSVETNIVPSRVNTQDSFDEVRIHSAKTMYPGDYTLKMDFCGKITKNMDGVYPCFFEDNGVKKELVATQFESHHAREAFPCIDEPEAKATFKLSLTHAKGEVALSNTPVEKEIENGSQTTTTFGKTPVMSTYLVAFVTGELKYKEAKSKSGVKIRTYSVPSQIENTEFALEVAVKAMDFYEEYYDIPFPLQKCDFVALPDFASGAMENWGLITFREQALLCDEHTSLSSKQYVAIVVAHELTHQWFGNLVTMRWWTDLWLNEGFASWMEYLAVDHLYPQWHLWTQFSVDEQQTALRADSLEHTHPVEVPVKHPDEIRTIFDIISYQKGASVIHMLHDFLGPDGFRDGLRHYLKTHAYSNTDTIDLWQALEDITKKPVKDFMGAWTSQSGYPILNVSSKDNHLKIEQTRFVTNPASKERKDTTLWPVPLLTKGLEPSVISKKVTNTAFKKNTPIKINMGQTGFYRVNYSHELQLAQLKAIDENAYDDNDRMGLLSDSLESTKAGFQPVNEYLDLLEHFKHESTLPVWEIISGSIGNIRQNLSTSDEDDNLRDAIKPFIGELVKAQKDRLGWEEHKGESHLDTLLRPLIIGMSAGADDPETVKIAFNKYKQKIDDGVHVNSDLRGVIYGTVARKGGKKEFDELLSLYKKSTSSDEKLSITGAMTNFKQPELHDKVLAMLKTDVVRLQDTSYWIAYSFMNRHSRKATWEWLKENWDWLKKNIGTDLSFSRTPIYAARTFSDDAIIKEFEIFFKARMEPAIERSYNQGLEIAHTNSAWRKRDSKTAYDWFKNS